MGTKLDLHKEEKYLTTSVRSFHSLNYSLLNAIDYRDQQVSTKTAEKVVKDLKLLTYIDCSARTQTGLKSVFDEAILTAIEPLEKKNEDKCTIL